MNEVESMFHTSPESYYKCIRNRFTDNLVIKKYVRSLEENSGSRCISSLFKSIKSWIVPSWTNKAIEFICCGFAFDLNIRKVERTRAKTMIALANRFFWLHFLIVLFNLGDLVKDITFTAAVQHFDTNIVQGYEPETSSGGKISNYEQLRGFNVHYVFITSVALIMFSQLVTYIYWTMISRKPNFLMSCEHQGGVSRVCQLLIQYLPSTLPILLFAQDTSVKITLGEQHDSRQMDPAYFLDHLELLYEERLGEKTSLNIKIIEVVCETYGQLIVQSVVLLRLKTLIQTDYFNYFGISFEVIIMLSMVISVLSLFTTFWSYHTRSKQRFRRLLSTSTFLQLVTWILLIITKLAIYVISFINFPGLFFVPVLIQFCVTLVVLTFTNVSPSFRASAWHDRLIHCMVCCVLPLAVSDDPQWQLQDVSITKFKKPEKQEEENDKESCHESEGDTNHSFEHDDGSLQSFGSITRILKKDKRTLKRTNTCFEEFEKKSRNEMMLALFLYTFECISVTAFSAIMYQEYHFDKYREYLEQTFVGQFFSFVPFIESYYGVIGLMCGTVIVVVILSSILIITYYKRLHPRLNMFTVYSSSSSKSMGESTTAASSVDLALTPTRVTGDTEGDKEKVEQETEETGAEYFV